MGNFPTCKKHIPLCKHAELRKRYSNDIELLIQEFETRLTFSKEEDTLLRLIEDPFHRMQKNSPLICRWRLLNFRARQFAEINAGKAAFLSSTVAWM
jgi:hypothetical protein